MKLKNEQGIERLSVAHANTVSYASFPEWHGREASFRKGYTQAQQDILASASESFEEWITNYFSLEGSTDIEEDVNMQSIEYDELKEAWQACFLSHAKKMQEKDAKLSKISDGTLKNELLKRFLDLQKENEELKEALDYVCRGLGFYTDFRTDEGGKLSGIIEKWLKGESK